MNLQLAIWLPYWRLRMRYHRYTVEGLEHLDGPQAKLIAGYHGRGVALDMCMLNIAIYDRLHYMPHSLMHRVSALVPWWHWLLDGLEFFVGDGPALAAAVRRGEHLIVTPGGAKEACRRWDDSYRVHWGEHVGYVRLAVKYGLPIVPVGAAGADGTYIGLNDGPAFGRRLGIPKNYAYLAWLGFGPLGLYPWSPPFPARFNPIAGPHSVGLLVHSLSGASLGHFLDTHDDQLAPRQFEKTFNYLAHSFAYWAQALHRLDLLAPNARLLGLTNVLHDSLLDNAGLIAAAKAALDMYVRHLAIELGPFGHRVNLLKFPTVVTPALHALLGPAAIRRIEEVHRGLIPAGRICTVEDVARFVSLLARPETDWLTGAMIDFTGGMMLRLLDVVLQPDSSHLRHRGPARAATA